jgi:hypothetical protein
MRGELITRVESATGASEELDALIMCALVAPAGAYVEKSPFNGAWCIYNGKPQGGVPRLWERSRGWYRPEDWPLTASVDATLALVEWVLPGWRRSLYERVAGEWEAALGQHYLGRVDKGPHQVVTASAPTPALALILATLRALPEPQDPPK